MLSLRREDGQFRVIDKLLNDDATENYIVKFKGEEGLIISAKSLNINEVELDGEPVQFYEFHIYNPHEEMFNCISTIPNTVLANFLEKLKESESKVGWISLNLIEKKAKKGKKTYYDFNKVVLSSKVVEKKLNNEYEECGYADVIEDETLFEF